MLQWGLRLSTLRMCIDRRPSIIFTCCHAGCLGEEQRQNVFLIFCASSHMLLFLMKCCFLYQDWSAAKHMILEAWDTVSQSIEFIAWITARQTSLKSSVKSPASQSRFTLTSMPWMNISPDHLAFLDLNPFFSALLQVALLTNLFYPALSFFPEAVPRAFWFPPS